MKVSVKDFQIVKSASLEFVPGLTVIQGESNNGKTALFRAIKSCIYNEPGTSNVRIGCKNYMVGIEHKGHKVILQKGENSLYLIDGQQYNKIGKQQLPEVANALGIQALSINDNTEKINFWDQMEKPFLLDRNSSELFRFIVDSGEDDNLNNTLRSMVTDKNRLNTEKNLKEGSITTLKQQIDNMESLLAGSQDKIEFCESVISYGPVTSKLLTINTIITNITNTTNTIERANKEITEKRDTLTRVSEEMNTLSYNISKKAQLNDFIEKYKNIKVNLITLSTQLENKVDTNEIPNIGKMIELKSKLNEKLTKASELNAIINTNKVAPITMSLGQDEVNRMSTLKSVLDRISVIQHQIKSINDNVATLTNDIQPVLTEYNSIEICPYCGNKIDNNHKEVTA